MDGLRALGLGYLAAASLFVAAFVVSHHPQLAPTAHNLETARDEIAARFEYHFVRPVKDLFRKSETVPQTKPAAPPRILKHADNVIYIQPRVFQPLTSKAPPVVAAPVSVEIPPAPPAAVAPTPQPRVVQVLDHLKTSLTDDMRNHFDLFLYVSKARKGPLSQRMYVVAKDDLGQLTILYDWAASTGRDKLERNPLGQKSLTHTPAGYYSLDPNRMYRTYRSRTWGSSMPYAMFFDFEENGIQSGIAIHAALNKNLSKLGTRASAGCIRLAPKNARILFNLVRNNYRGQSPRFAYDDATKTVSNTGTFAYGSDGKLQFADGYKVLVFVENYSGTENVMAELL